MNDRDFKLLVREYFQTLSMYHNSSVTDVRLDAWDKQKELSKRILSELEDFTRRDVEELPFKD